MTKEYLQKLGFAPVVEIKDASQVAPFQLIDSYLFQNVVLATDGEILYASFGVNTNQAHLRTTKDLTQTNQIVGEFTTEEPDKLEALVEAFYATRGGRGKNMFPGFPF